MLQVPDVHTFLPFTRHNVFYLKTHVIPRSKRFPSQTFYYQLMHKRIVFKGLLKFTLKLQ